MSRGKGAASAAPEFPIVLAAIEEHEGTSKWKIADAILQELGPPSFGPNDGEAEKMSRFLAEHGHPEWAVETIGRMRFTAHAFSLGARLRDCSFDTHAQARSPEMLEEAFRRNGGKPPTRDFVRKMRREMREQEEAAERKRQADRQRRAEETERKAHEKAAAARDERERAKAEEQARKAEARREAIEREQAETERKHEERKRKEAEAKAARLAKELEDEDVAEALARDHQSRGALNTRNAVQEEKDKRRRKRQQEGEARRDAEALPLPAFVPKMIGDIDAWVIALRSISDDDLASLPKDPFVAQLANVVEDLTEEALRWNTVLGEERKPNLEVLEGTASDGPRRRLSA